MRYSAKLCVRTTRAVRWPDILERAGRVDVGRAPVDLVAQPKLDALFAHRPGHFLDVLRGLEDFGGRPLGRLDDAVELLGRANDLLVKMMRRLDARDLAARIGDRLGERLELGQDVCGCRLALRPEHRFFEPPDRFEQHVGLGRAAAPRIFGEEPPPARRGFERGFECGIMLGEVHLCRGVGRWVLKRVRPCRA